MALKNDQIQKGLLRSKPTTNIMKAKYNHFKIYEMPPSAPASPPTINWTQTEHIYGIHNQKKLFKN